MDQISRAATTAGWREDTVVRDRVVARLKRIVAAINKNKLYYVLAMPGVVYFVIF